MPYALCLLSHSSSVRSQCLGKIIWESLQIFTLLADQSEKKNRSGEVEWGGKEEPSGKKSRNHFQILIYQSIEIHSNFEAAAVKSKLQKKKKYAWWVWKEYEWVLAKRFIKQTLNDRKRLTISSSQSAKKWFHVRMTRTRDWTIEIWVTSLKFYLM